MTATDWTFGGTWPYEPKWFDTPDGRMHYVDEGPRGGRPVVMVHGNPTWSLLYRNIIPALSDDFRCVCVDYPGYGFSERPPTGSRPSCGRCSTASPSSARIASRSLVSVSIATRRAAKARAIQCSSRSSDWTHS